MHSAVVLLLQELLSQLLLWTRQNSLGRMSDSMQDACLRCLAAKNFAMGQWLVVACNIMFRVVALEAHIVQSTTLRTSLFLLPKSFWSGLSGKAFTDSILGHADQLTCCLSSADSMK